MQATLRALPVAFARGFLRFNRGLLQLPWAVQLWVGLLVAANIGSPWLFLEHPEAQVTLAVGLVGLALMSGLTARFGFSRIVGVGHLGWVPLVAFLLTRLPAVPPDDAFGLWLRVVIVLNSASLVFDALDALRFVRGERAELVPTTSATPE